jgi:hypothetical protein
MSLLCALHRKPTHSSVDNKSAHHHIHPALFLPLFLHPHSRTTKPIYSTSFTYWSFCSGSMLCLVRFRKSAVIDPLASASLHGPCQESQSTIITLLSTRLSKKMYNKRRCHCPSGRAVINSACVIIHSTITAGGARNALVEPTLQNNNILNPSWLSGCLL